MRALTARRRVTGSVIAAALVSMAVLVGTIVAAGQLGATSGIALALLAAGVVAASVLLIVLPVHWLPAIAVVAFAAVPNNMVPNDGILRAVPVMTLILAVWAVRRLLLASADPADARTTRSGLVVLATLFSDCLSRLVSR